jgi:hypothetical protein
VPAWNRRRHYAGDQARTLAYILVLDTINFSFWGASGGYWRLAEGLRDAFLAGAPLWEPGFLCQVDEEQLSGWVGELPMMSERARALRELGEVGVLDELVQPTAYGTAATLARRLHSFADIPDYAGREVPILKRAQIAAADLHGAGVARFGDMDQLTCFADYKLPQALRHLGVLEYSPDLARRVDSWQELEPGEPAEVEIRAATVIAVERLRERLEQEGRSLRAFEVDWMLWELSQGLYPARPHHRVRTIHY